MTTSAPTRNSTTSGDATVADRIARGRGHEGAWLDGLSLHTVARFAEVLGVTILPVLIVSGYAEVEGIAPDLPRLTKPFRPADLATSLAGLARATGSNPPSDPNGSGRGLA